MMKPVKSWIVNRISAEDVFQRMQEGEKIFLVDTRNENVWREADTKIPGAIRIPADAVEQHLADVPKDRLVITYCT